MAFSQEETAGLLVRAATGDADSLGRLLAIYRPRLRRTIAIRMDPRLSARVDESDVIQETCIEATQRIGEYFEDRATPFFVWLRFLATQKLMTLHRRHIGAQIRDVTREIPLWAEDIPAASSEVLATHLLAASSSPSSAAQKSEMKMRLQQALERMDVMDREVLTMRHFEQLSSFETAHVLGINPSTASSRYVRALRRLKKELGDLADWLA